MVKASCSSTRISVAVCSEPGTPQARQQRDEAQEVDSGDKLAAGRESFLPCAPVPCAAVWVSLYCSPESAMARLPVQHAPQGRHRVSRGNLEQARQGGASTVSRANAASILAGKASERSCSCC